MSFIWPINDELIAHIDSQWTTDYDVQASQCFCYYFSNFSPGLQASYLSSYLGLLFLAAFHTEIVTGRQNGDLGIDQMFLLKPFTDIWSEFRYQSHFLKNMFTDYLPALTKMFWRKCNCCLWYIQLALSLRIHHFWQPKGQIIWTKLIWSAIQPCLKLTWVEFPSWGWQAWHHNKGQDSFRKYFRHTDPVLTQLNRQDKMLAVNVSESHWHVHISMCHWSRAILTLLKYHMFMTWLWIRRKRWWWWS